MKLRHQSILTICQLIIKGILGTEYTVFLLKRIEHRLRLVIKFSANTFNHGTNISQTNKCILRRTESVVFHQGMLLLLEKLNRQFQRILQQIKFLDKRPCRIRSTHTSYDAKLVASIQCGNRFCILGILQTRKHLRFSFIRRLYKLIPVGIDIRTTNIFNPCNNNGLDLHGNILLRKNKSGTCITSDTYATQIIIRARRRLQQFNKRKPGIHNCLQWQFRIL